jgi:hypothetical protein
MSKKLHIFLKPKVYGDAKEDEHEVGEHQERAENDGGDE